VKAVERWYSDRVGREISMARWGTWGAPVLVFPTAGGDAEEIERNHLVAACGELLDAGRIKIYSCDSLAGRVALTKEGTPAYRLWLLNQYQQCVRYEVVPAIRADTGGQELPVVVAGSSIGAFNSLAVLCRWPEVFGRAICMSGTYKLERFYDDQFTDDLFYASPLHFLPGLQGPDLDLLRTRFAVLASGEGAWEDVGESWAAADVLGAKGIPNRVDNWGPGWDHEWPTWRRMLPQYLTELL
jgi:esterase/lipase superfamily enzyme